MSGDSPRYDEIRIRLLRDQPSLRGSVAVAGEPERPFESWLGLLAVLTDATAGRLGAGGGKVRGRPTMRGREGGGTIAERRGQRGSGAPEGE